MAGLHSDVPIKGSFHLKVVFSGADSASTSGLVIVPFDKPSCSWPVFAAVNATTFTLTFDTDVTKIVGFSGKQVVVPGTAANHVVKQSTAAITGNVITVTHGHTDTASGDFWSGFLAVK
jgi:hypothetical protein